MNLPNFTNYQKPKTKSQRLILYSLFFILLLLLPSSILAQTPPAAPAAPEMVSSITSIPPRLQLKAKPGETLQETIKIRNESETEKAFETEVKDFIVTDDKGTPQAVEEEVSGRWSLTSWTKVAPSRALVQPKTSRSFSLIINVPADALPGGHYAMVIYRPVTEGVIGKTAAQVSQEVTTLVYLQVEGPITEDAQLVEYRTDKQVEEYGPVKFFVAIKNLSDIHIRPKGKIVIENVLLSKVTQRPVRTLVLEEKNIFPEAIRKWESQLPGKWHFGQYRASLEAAYGTQGKVLTGVIYFWIVPYKIAAACLGTLLIMLALVLFLIRRSRKKKKEES